MTVGELYKEVSHLGFETSLDDGTMRFYQALNRCLLQASKLKPVVKRVHLAHYRPKNILGYGHCEKVYTNEGEDIVFEAKGALSYYFEASGAANYEIDKLGGDVWQTIDNQTRVTSKSKEFRPYFGTISNVGKDDSVRIVFSGDYFFTVRNIAFYAQKIGENDLAFNSENTEYDFSHIYADFNGFVSDPTDSSGMALSDECYSIIRQNTLCIRNDYCGTVTVEYEHRPETIAYREEPDLDETVVDADAEICSILPYLIASYVWLDDEPAKAQYYKVMYEERAQEIRSRTTVQTPIKINTHGW